MTGAIPPYGANFQKRSAREWHAWYGSAMYAWRGDTSYYIRADKTSHKWWVFHYEIPMSGEFHTLTHAMAAFLLAVAALKIPDIRKVAQP